MMTLKEMTHADAVEIGLPAKPLECTVLGWTSGGLVLRTTPEAWRSARPLGRGDDLQVIAFVAGQYQADDVRVVAVRTVPQYVEVPDFYAAHGRRREHSHDAVNVVVDSSALRSVKVNGLLGSIVRVEGGRVIVVVTGQLTPERRWLGEYAGKSIDVPGLEAGEFDGGRRWTVPIADPAKQVFTSPVTLRLL